MPTGKPGTKSPHGTANRYRNHGCRCERCRKAWSVYFTARRQACGHVRPRSIYLAEIKARADLLHGRESSYNRGCRCDACRDAAADARRQRRHADLEASRAYDREYKRRKRAA